MLSYLVTSNSCAHMGRTKCQICMFLDCDLLIKKKKKLFQVFLSYFTRCSVRNFTEKQQKRRNATLSPNKSILCSSKSVSSEI